MSVQRGSQPRVPHEALTWCIGAISERAWREEGLILEKAHRVKAVRSGFLHSESGEPILIHKPVCGAQVKHYESECVEGNEGWPACRNCVRKTVNNVPDAFRE